MSMLLASLITLIGGLSVIPISYDVSVTEQQVEITLTNLSDESVYIFDGYLFPINVSQDEVYLSDYSHYYDAKDDMNILSFVPILPYVGGAMTDAIRLGHLMVAHGWFPFSFSEISPGRSFSFSIPKESFQWKDYYKKMDFTKYSVYSGSVDFKRSKKHSESSFCIELALYTEIDIVGDKDAYYACPGLFDAQARDYEIVRIILPDLSMPPEMIQ